jgi:hypothetical protein
MTDKDPDHMGAPWTCKTRSLWKGMEDQMP